MHCVLEIWGYEVASESRVRNCWLTKTPFGNVRYYGISPARKSKVLSPPLKNEK